jgi:transcriptional activator cubitus interruptus
MFASFFFKVSELPMVLRAMIDFDQSPASGGVSVMAPVEHGQRGRFRSRLHHKGGLLQPPSPNANDYLASSSPRSVYGIGELNRRITDLKVDNPALSPPQNFARDTSPKLLELGQNYPNSNCHYQPTTMMQYNQQMNPQIRRDSNNSTTSSSYYSMKSCDISRRSSQQSHTSSMSTLRPNYVNYDPQFYDPISAGSSRRSSQLSTNEGANYGPPSSQLLSSHLARLQRHSAMPNNHPYHPGYGYQPNQYYGYQQPQPGYGNFYNYNQPNQSQMMNMSQMPTSSTDRRMSEPISNSSRTVTNPPTVPRRPRSTTPTKSLEMLLVPTKEKEKPEAEASSPSKPHPNETVVLDVLKTNEKIENCDELVIPDEMVMYLMKGGDETTEMSTGSAKIKLDLDGEIEPMSSSISIEKIKEEDLFELLAEVEVKPEEDDESSENLEINNNGELKAESDIGSGKTRQILCKS